RVQPSVAPMQNSGVTSPPLKLLPSVSAVKRIFQKNAHEATPPSVKLSTKSGPADDAREQSVQSGSQLGEGDAGHREGERGDYHLADQRRAERYGCNLI